jgi:hypothetical protein
MFLCTSHEAHALATVALFESAIYIEINVGEDLGCNS